MLRLVLDIKWRSVLCCVARRRKMEWLPSRRFTFSFSFWSSLLRSLRWAGDSSKSSDLRRCVSKCRLSIKGRDRWTDDLLPQPFSCCCCCWRPRLTPSHGWPQGGILPQWQEAPEDEPGRFCTLMCVSWCRFLFVCLFFKFCKYLYFILLWRGIKSLLILQTINNILGIWKGYLSIYFTWYTYVHPLSINANVLSLKNSDNTILLIQIWKTAYYLSTTIVFNLFVLHSILGLIF